MTEIKAPILRTVRPFTWWTLGVSVLVAGGGWSLLIWINEILFNPPSGFFGDLLPFLFVVVPVGFPVAIVLNIVAGDSGAANRVLAVISGLLLLTPLLSFLLAYLSGR